MSPRMTCADLPSAISSPASAAGPSPCDLPAGPTTDPSGPVPAPASPSRPLDAAKARTTTATSGQPSTVTSASAALQSSLANRLMQRFDTAGSTLFKLTWKWTDTPSGGRICRLRASARRTGDSDCGSWRTPTAGHKAKGGAQCPEKRLAGGHTVDLQDQVRLASWATPTARDHKDSTSEGTVPVNGLLGRQVWSAGSPDSGPAPNGMPAATGKPGQLNPAFSLWLMGYSAGWLWCAPVSKPRPRYKTRSGGSAGPVRSEEQGTPSSRRSRRKSSRPTSDRKSVV